MNGRVLQKENCSPLPSLAVETKCLCFRRLMRSENNSIRYLPLIKLKAWNSFHIHIFNFFLFPSPPHPPGKLLLEERRKSRPFYPHPRMIRFQMSCCVPFVEIRWPMQLLLPAAETVFVANVSVTPLIVDSKPDLLKAEIGENWMIVLPLLFTT